MTPASDRAASDRAASDRAASDRADSDRAELSTLRAQLDELVERVTKLATRYDDSDDSAVADDLFASERALMTARRTLERATTRLND